jgi:hypothetical protein
MTRSDAISKARVLGIMEHKRMYVAEVKGGFEVCADWEDAQARVEKGDWVTLAYEEQVENGLVNKMADGRMEEVR